MIYACTGCLDSGKCVWHEHMRRRRNEYSDRFKAAYVAIITNSSVFATFRNQKMLRGWNSLYRISKVAPFSFELSSNHSKVTCICMLEIEHRCLSFPLPWKRHMPGDAYACEWQQNGLCQLAGSHVGASGRIPHSNYHSNFNPNSNSTSNSECCCW